ncbi:hypothetical protein L207DRAFT_565787 [Hyaloscypha variabilis F]|uniref:Uncharacterized protein n=1 Tax=Hyaloscypha variabilis (strain UAMH 11265 / GT02V1 / F) TaxID=1149755 RepID=A0A2J6RP54_HYAVF|nr:hypothetical protein L207DRAFT_565787 [Hyaloscypha variabilis F]
MPQQEQRVLDFLVVPQPRAPGSPTPLLPRISPSKRTRALTAGASPTLPPNRRRRTAAAWKAPALKPTESYMFKGLCPLYTCHVVEEEHTKMEIRCTQPRCTHSRKIDRILHGTNNYKIYYRN